MLRKKRLAELKPGDEDYALNTLLAALATLPAKIEGVEAWRAVQFMELEHLDCGEIKVNDIVMRDEPVDDEYIKSL